MASMATDLLPSLKNMVLDSPTLVIRPLYKAFLRFTSSILNGVMKGRFTMNEIEALEAIYARQSLDKKDSISIEGQVEHCKAFAEHPEKVLVYEDKGYSGKDTNRPRFTDLIRDIKLGKVKKIIVYRLDRMTRSLLDFTNLLVLFQEYGVTFESTHEKFDTSSPVGQAMVQILMVFAELERKTIQQRVKDNYYQRGVFNGNFIIHS